jgi:endonuclease/exonuclease/phosphatase (EEP) superfamily protein YafD
MEGLIARFAIRPPALALLVGCAAVSAPAPIPSGPRLTVLTYNVNFEQYDPATVAAIATADADLVVLQETNARWEAEVRRTLADRYPTIRFEAHEPDGGMGVLSRFPVTPIAWRPSPVGKFPAWCLAVETPHGPLNVLALHLHPPLDEEGSLLAGYFTTSGARLTELTDHLGCFAGPPDLALGDLNEGEGDAVDLLVARGLSDAAEALPPAVRTWRWDTPIWELEGRPDHVFHGPGWAPAAVDVLELGASDHRPLRVTLARVAP